MDREQIKKDLLDYLRSSMVDYDYSDNQNPPNIPNITPDDQVFKSSLRDLLSAQQENVSSRTDMANSVLKNYSINVDRLTGLINKKLPNLVSSLATSIRWGMPGVAGTSKDIAFERQINAKIAYNTAVDIVKSLISGAVEGTKGLGLGLSGLSSVIKATGERYPIESAMAGLSAIESAKPNYISSVANIMNANTNKKASDEASKINKYKLLAEVISQPSSEEQKAANEVELLKTYGKILSGISKIYDTDPQLGKMLVNMITSKIYGKSLYTQFEPMSFEQLRKLFKRGMGTNSNRNNRKKEEKEEGIQTLLIP